MCGGRGAEGEAYGDGDGGGGGSVGLLVEFDEFLEDVELVGLLVDFLVE